MRFYKTASYQFFISKQGIALTLLALVVSLSSALLAYFGKTESVDWLLYDNAMKWSQLAPADDIVIIDIDDKSLSQLGRWPWARNVHAELLEKLSQVKTTAIVFDVLFPELVAANYASDVRFAQAIRQNGRVILPIYLETLGQQGQVIESPPHNLFYQEVKALGHVHLPVEIDGVVRSVFLKEGVGKPFWPHLSLALLESVSPQAQQLEWLIPGKRAEQAASNIPSVGISRDFYNLLPMPGPTQGLRHYSYSDMLNGFVDINTLHDKIVFIGATAAGLGDILATPVGSMNGVELNAWIFQALRKNQLIQTRPVFELALIGFLSVLLITLVLGRLSPRVFLVASFLSVVGALSVSTYLLLHRNLWFPPASIIVGIVAFFPLWSWLRAESILRFLRAEIEALSAANIPKRDKVDRQKAAQYFLEQMGLLDVRSQQQTPKGERAIQTLYSDKDKALNADFWQQQLAQHASNSGSITHSYQGVEVIARTISQLNEIKESDKKNRQLIEKSLSRLQDAVCIADLCGEMTFTNKRFDQWFKGEHNADTLLGILNALELKSGLTWSKVICEVYQTNKLFSDEARFKDALNASHDQQFLCQASLVSINEAHLDTLILTFTDITQLKAAENARSEALSFLSHDLRSPMVSVLAILERYHQSGGANNQQLSNDAIQHIESLVRKNLDYAESFLQLSKADALIETNMSPCDLHAVLDAAQVQAMALAAPKNIKVITERCDEDVWVLGDIALLERAVTNLISNAIKFSPEHSQLRLRLIKLETEAQLSVQDQGSGIDNKDQTSIFHRFTRLKNSDAIEGAGLGLNFVETVAKKHQGRVELESEVNMGSKFILCLPVLSEQELFEFEE